MVHLRTFLLPSVYPITLLEGIPFLCDQAWHSLSNEKKLILPSSTLRHNR